MKANPEPKMPLGMQVRIPAGEAASGSDGLFEAVIAYHEARPSSLSGKRNDKKHVVAINEGSQMVAQLRSRPRDADNPFRVENPDTTKTL
jgi:hypothetical protein